MSAKLNRMKKDSLLVVICLLLSVPTWSQALRQAETSLVYYMPFTTLVFDIEYDEITEEQGQFYQYSERYLRTTDIVKENKTTYRLTDIRLRTVASADTARLYTVPFQEKYPYCSRLSLNNKGILLGVNIEAQKSDKPNKPAMREERHPMEDCSHRPVPLLEEQLLANSTAKMAENTAKQIYRIRESRLNILSGDVEHLPADGKSMELVLKELDAQERTLTQLFVGKREIRKQHKRICLVPTVSMDKEVLFRFSLYNGVVDKDDMSGNPFYITLNKHQQTYSPAQKGDEKAHSLMSPIYYNLPGQAQILLTDGERTYVETAVDVAQWGIAVALPYALFKETTQIEMNPKTGAIKSVRQ